MLKIRASDNYKNQVDKLIFKAINESTLLATKTVLFLPITYFHIR